MIPYFSLTTIHAGPVPIQAWGLFVAMGILAAMALSSRALKRDGLDGRVAWDAGIWAILGAFIGARIFHVLIYAPSFYLQNPLEILAIWKGGLSIVGGFLGGTLSLYAYFRAKRLPFRKYAQHIAFYLPLGLGIGRIGCFLIHDHPGIACAGACLLGVGGTNGPQYDHGLLLSLNGFLLFLFFLVLKKAGRKVNYPALFLLWYGIVRFFLDFMRAWDGPVVDARLFFLTPAQYASIAFALAGIWLLARGRRTQKRV